MIFEAQYYYPIYLTIIVVFTFFMSVTYAGYTNERLLTKSNQSRNHAIALIFTIIMAIFIGMRPISIRYFVDMGNYREFYNTIQGLQFNFDWSRGNYLFDNLFLYLASNRFALVTFFLIIAAIYFGALFWACRELFPKDTLYAIIIYLSAFSTFSYGTNGIKAGAAASLFLCAFAYYKKWTPCIVCLFLSLGFHHSMVLPIIAFILGLFYDKPKVYIYIWVLSLLISAAHITFFQTLFASFSDEGGASYLSDNDSGYRSGFRLDFIIYSAVPIALGYWCIFKRNYQSKKYNHIFNTYVLTNAVWMLCMYASFTNRIAYLSWLMIPFVLIYPFFDKPFIKRQYKVANAVAWYHLAFTLFMSFVYYGYLK